MTGGQGRDPGELHTSACAIVICLAVAAIIVGYVILEHLLR